MATELLVMGVAAIFMRVTAVVAVSSVSWQMSMSVLVLGNGGALVAAVL